MYLGGAIMNSRKTGNGSRPGTNTPRGWPRTALALILLGAATAAFGQIIQEFPTLPPGRAPEGIVLGPDGNMWIAEEGGNRIGKISPSGALLDEFPIATANSSPETIVVGPDGNLWFTMWQSDRVGRITTTGVITEFPTL